MRLTYSCKACAEELGEDYIFDIITKDRVHHFAAANYEELQQWLAILTLLTDTIPENILIANSEANIRQSTRTRALEMEARYLREYQEEQLKREAKLSQSVAAAPRDAETVLTEKPKQ